MANSDIVLHDDYVEVKGDGLEVNGRLRANALQARSTRRNARIVMFSHLTFRPDTSGDGPPQAGRITMVNSARRRTTVTLDGESGDLRISGRVSAANCFFRERVNSPQVTTSDIKVGVAGGEESTGRNGKLTMLNASGQNAIVMDAAQARIMIRGYGDLVQKVKDLEAKVAQLQNALG